MSAQLTLDEAARARATDPDTSHQAARSVSRLTEKRAAVLKVIRDLGSGTDVDIAAHYQGPKQSESGLRTRRSELVELGLVRDSGERVKLPSGRMAAVWELT